MSLSSYSATGNLGRDAETRQAGSATVASFPLAVTVGFGERQSTMWVRCNIWGARATGKLIPYLVKGQSVAVSGELTENAYTGNDGIEKKSLELNVNTIDLIGNRPDNQQQKQQQQSKPAPQPASPSAGPDYGGGNDYLNDDIPF